MIMKKCVVYLILTGMIFSSCEKDFQNFNLPLNNSLDVNTFKRQSFVLNCENLNQVSFFDPSVPIGSDWSIGGCVVNNGFNYYSFNTGSCGFDFPIQNDSLSSISFWTNKDSKPELYIDGEFYELIESQKGDSVTSSLDYTMHESAAIYPGQHNVRIYFGSPSYSICVDQIVQWVK